MTTVVPLTAYEAGVFGRVAQPGGWRVQLRDGAVVVISARLPGRMVISVARQGPLLWVVIDLTKRESYEEAIVTMAGWEASPGNRWASVQFPALWNHTLAEVERLVTAGTYDGRCVTGRPGPDQDPWSPHGHPSRESGAHAATSETAGEDS